MEEQRAWILEKSREVAAKKLANIELKLQEEDFEQLRSVAGRVCSHATGAGYEPFAGFTTKERDVLIDQAIRFLNRLKDSPPPIGRKSLRVPWPSVAPSEPVEMREPSLQLRTNELGHTLVPVYDCNVYPAPECLNVEIIERGDLLCFGVSWGGCSTYSQENARSHRRALCEAEKRIEYSPNISIDLSDIKQFVNSSLIAIIFQYELNQTRVFAVPANSWIRLEDIGRSVTYPGDKCKTVCILPRID